MMIMMMMVMNQEMNLGLRFFLTTPIAALRLWLRAPPTLIIAAKSRFCRAGSYGGTPTEKGLICRLCNSNKWEQEIRYILYFRAKLG